jgi:haloacetate dehalogenase
MDGFEGFEARRFAVNGVNIYARIGGTPGKPPLLLLHGFPQSHVMWRRVAQALALDFALVLPDLRGYGDSAAPPDEQGHSNASKRAMAQDLVELMQALGHHSFYLCGHDRGGRVAHRLAVDYPQRVKKLCVIDIAPTLDMYNATDMAFARAYYHWFHLIQPSPLPETMINAAWKSYLHAKLGGWGAGGLAAYEPEAIAEYERHFAKPETIHAMCEDYRASAGIDLEHDRAARTAGQKVACDLLVLWGERGVVHRMFKPMDLWQAQCAGHVTGRAMLAGHFIPEELPADTAQALRAFMTQDGSASHQG